MTQRRELVGRGVARAGPDLLPVRHVHDRGDDVAAQLAQLVAFEQRHPDGQRHQHGEQRREEPAGAPDPELPHVDGRRAFLLRDEQQRDEVARDHEEDLDAEVATRQPIGVGVVHHDRHDGEGAHAVEPRQVGHAADLRRARRRLPTTGEFDCAVARRDPDARAGARVGPGRRVGGVGGRGHRVHLALRSPPARGCDRSPSPSPAG